VKLGNNFTRHHLIAQLLISGATNERIYAKQLQCCFVSFVRLFQGFLKRKMLNLDTIRKYKNRETNFKA